MLTPEQVMGRINKRLNKRLLQYQGKQFTNTILAQVRAETQDILTYLHTNNEVEPPPERPFHAKPRASVRRTWADTMALELYWATDFEEEMRQKAGAILEEIGKDQHLFTDKAKRDLVWSVNAKLKTLPGADKLSRFFLTYETNAKSGLKFSIVVEE